MKTRNLKRHSKNISEQRLYSSIMKQVMPEIKKALNESADLDDVEECDELEEAELNELFGLGSNVKKPELALSVDNSDEENAKIFIQWCEYFISKAGNNVANAVVKLSEVCSKVLVNGPMFIVKGLLMVLSRTVKLTIKGATGIANIITTICAMLVKCVKSGIKSADVALKKAYNELLNKVKAGYNKFKSNTSSFLKEANEVLTMWLGIAAAVCKMTAAKFEGAVDAFSDWVDDVIDDVEDGIEAAALLVKTWISSKSKDVLNMLTETKEDIKSATIKVWDGIKSESRKAYNKLTDELEKWMSSFKDLVDELAKKIDTGKEKVKSFVIDKKDKALVYNIQKSVKGLSDKFKEEEVVALVRKCYNENLILNKNGKYVINEAYFYDRNSKPRKVYENHKKIINAKRINS